MGFIHTFKRDLARHRHKAAVLGVLFAVMVFMGVRAVFQMQPQRASAITITETDGASAPAVSNAAEASERIRLSKELWRRLWEKGGVSGKDAFTFEATYYPPDPTRPMVTPLTPEPETRQQPVARPDDGEIVRRALMLRLREQLVELKVQSTTVSTGKPWAIVNGQLVSVGDQVKGFEISAIRPREVDFTKEGVTSVVKMPDDFRGQ